jgi:hypothetical protein
MIDRIVDPELDEGSAKRWSRCFYADCSRWRRHRGPYRSALMCEAAVVEEVLGDSPSLDIQFQELCHDKHHRKSFERERELSS